MCVFTWPVSSSLPPNTHKSLLVCHHQFDPAGQGYGSYGSAQGMGGFANQQSQHSQPPQYQSYGDSSAGTPTAGVASSKQPAYDGYSNYNSFSSQPSFGGQKADLYSGHSSHGSQPQVSSMPMRQKTLRRSESCMSGFECKTHYWFWAWQQVAHLHQQPVTGWTMSWLQNLTAKHCCCILLSLLSGGMSCSVRNFQKERAAYTPVCLLHVYKQSWFILSLTSASHLSVKMPIKTAC